MEKVDAFKVCDLKSRGGEPARAGSFLSWPSFGVEEIEAATAVLRSGRVNYWTGEECKEFERAFASYCGAEHAVAVANGTVALELALRALEIGEGDEVIVPARTFIATASAVVLSGATPVFADVDRNSQNITVETVREVLGPRCKGIIVVHLAGWPCEMDPIMRLASEQGLKVIEDCAQAHGAEYRGRKVGSLGDAAAFSFCQDKIVSTGGEGGMLLTRHSRVWERAWSYKDHGKNYEKVHQTPAAPGFRWLHDTIGTNWRMTEMQAAIGRCQLRKVEGWLERRRENAARLTRCFRTLPGLRVATPSPGTSHAFYRYYAYVCPDQLATGWCRDRIMIEICDQGVPCFTGICPELYQERAFENVSELATQPLSVARELGDTSLAFLVHPTLGEREMTDVCRAVGKVMAIATTRNNENLTRRVWRFPGWE